MLKEDYFKECLKNRLYIKKEWLISIFSIFDITDSYKKELYNYKLFKNDKKYIYYFNEQYIELEDSDIKYPLFNLKDNITIDSKVSINVNGKLTTTYGRVIFNKIALEEPFGDKIPYINNKTSVGFIENIISDRLQDTPKPNQPRDKKFIYVDEYIKFCNGLSFLSGLTQIAVWAETPKLMLPPTGINEYKKKLLDENKGHLDDLNVVVDIEKKLIEYDSKYLENDPGAEYFANSSKSRNIVRKKLFLMYGVDSTEPGAIAKPVLNSLYEGWDINNFPQMNNATRYGSYGRGFETQLGGELSKWLLRASSSIRITNNDCGTKLGFRLLVTKTNYYNLAKLYYFDEKSNLIFIDNTDQAKELIGKNIVLRSPMYCKQPGTDICKYCIGEKLSINPTALSSALADFGSIILEQALAKFHGKAISTNDFSLDLLS